jgi:hypothetical protein
MNRRAFVLALCLVSVPAPSFAWGSAAHQYIMGRAIGLLPATLRPFFERHRDELVMRVNDPDLWRVAGWDEGPHHFLDFGGDEYGAYPFTLLPRDRAAAVRRFGEATVRKNGLLPWRAEEMFGRLRSAFEDVARRRPFAESNAVFFAAVTAHYFQDAHQPLHATVNHDGQLTGQTGLHSRFETALFERFEDRLSVTPPRPVAMTAPRDAAFDILIESYRLVDPLLVADREAAAGRRTYNDAYYTRFLERAGPLLERRLADSIATTAGLIMGAWNEAGRPSLGASR